MDNTLDKNSGIWLLKSKFFLYRAVTYFSFLLIPIWAQKSLELTRPVQCLVMVAYIFFMLGQWFMLGKEIDHRLKIYFRVNSSIDRVVYRLFLGMFFIILYFNLLSFFPSKWIYNFFWVTWAFLGLFYSWPTRGKIIQESVSSSFAEFRYLDSFEKTLVGLTLLMFVISVPEFPSLVNNEALKLFFDPLEKFSPHFWNFLTVNYYPFKKYPELFKLAWCMHFYVVGIGTFLLIFYAFLRFFVSRRLSLLGVFALISSWSFSKIMAANYGATLNTTYSMLWIWALLWVTKSSTYRSGLFLGLVGYWGTLLNQSFALLPFVQIAGLYFLFLKDKTVWFRKQTLKYCSFGLALTVFVFVTHSNSFEHLNSIDQSFLHDVFVIIKRKAFYSLSFLGMIILIWKYFFPLHKAVKNLQFDQDKLSELCIMLMILLLYSVFFDAYLVRSFSVMWVVAFLSLLPLELIFQTMSRLRSKRNMIYMTYILICLLDSHSEGRLKIFLRLFDH